MKGGELMSRFWKSLSVKLHLAFGRLIVKLHVDWKSTAEKQ